MDFGRQAVVPPATKVPRIPKRTKIGGAVDAFASHKLLARSITTDLTPEEEARETIDSLLTAARSIVEDRTEANIDAGRGVAVRELSLGHGFGEADYLLLADGQDVGVVEAKPEGHTFTGVEIQTQRYSEGIPAGVPITARLR